jgi:CxxC-x17-CxxC domain-containing protein
MDFEVVCEECGKQTTVPFKPTGIRPVLCRQCFDAKGEADPEYSESSESN